MARDRGGGGSIVKKVNKPTATVQPTKPNKTLSRAPTPTVAPPPVPVVTPVAPQWQTINGFQLAPWATQADIDYAKTHKINAGQSAASQNWGADNRISPAVAVAPTVVAPYVQMAGNNPVAEQAALKAMRTQYGGVPAGETHTFPAQYGGVPAGETHSFSPFSGVTGGASVTKPQSGYFTGSEPKTENLYQASIAGTQPGAFTGSEPKGATYQPPSTAGMLPGAFTGSEPKGATYQPPAGFNNVTGSASVTGQAGYTPGSFTGSEPKAPQYYQPPPFDGVTGGASVSYWPGVTGGASVGGASQPYFAPHEPIGPRYYAPWSAGMGGGLAAGVAFGAALGAYNVVNSGSAGYYTSGGGGSTGGGGGGGGGGGYPRYDSWSAGLINWRVGT